ncbi:MAG: SDR family NAD(P)-dependent oxidoreductase [Phycisphaeraceae bacterium]|nr:SDR family NAD(P)-dependent oxidoreductase [Phycisphaeraceae bacterium]
MNIDLEQRHVVVTGGTGALGGAVVGALLGCGAQCHVPVFDPRELERFPHADAKGVHVTDEVDLRVESSVQAFYSRVHLAAGGRAPWASVHIAGGFAMGPIEDTKQSDFDSLVGLNLTTAFLCCREAVRAMKAQGEGGRIVNVAARPAIVPTSGAKMVAYTATKAGVAAMTEALAEEVAPDGILVNAIVPSIMDTPANRASMPGADYSKWPKVEEVAATVAFLVSPLNALTRAGLVPVYGRS